MLPQLRGEDTALGHVLFVDWQFDVPDADGQIPDVALEVWEDGHLWSVANVNAHHPERQPIPPERTLTPEIAEREIMIGQAGTTAWAIHRGRYMLKGYLKGGQGDVSDVGFYLRETGLDGRDERRFTRKTRALLKQNWAAVEALADELLNQRLITYTPAIAIIESALAPDGGETE